jgi:hypothetical protein
MQEARHWHAVAAVPANGRIYALGGWALEDAKVGGLVCVCVCVCVYTHTHRPSPSLLPRPSLLSCPCAEFRCSVHLCRPVSRALSRVALVFPAFLYWHFFFLTCLYLDCLSRSTSFLIFYI